MQTTIPAPGRYCPRCEPWREPTGDPRSEGHLAVRFDDRIGLRYRVVVSRNGERVGKVFEAEAGPSGWLVRDGDERCRDCGAFVKVVERGAVTVALEPWPDRSEGAA